MDGDELLLLPDRPEEPEGVRAEPDNADQRDRGEAGERAHEQCRSLARVATGEHEERQREAGRELHADSRRERARAGAPM